ncbi:uncharacterized protein with PCYCGC motif [Aneurinibacillus soli]|uniref:Uncharacterized protein n=1 Tax=Aneurinibacillus soli TaxID=1500254 RepID=A0A0U4WM28_9BACL|nr:PCYCGC domain-containing protein [Aneurinibacillus soli]PYE59862.1 uncharacterized protein with PCYCGC motif [Aneurinibacillus soli]BAU29416.1 hypothetical protein CB4_03616 [Aneurinibacillus soli]
MNRFFHTTTILLLLATAGLTGCSSESASKSQDEHTTHDTGHVAGDLIEETSGANKLPSFLSNMDPQIAQVYQAVGYNYQTVEHMACYCGCGESVGHKSNRDCFIQEIKPSGAIVWNSHGATCNNCLEIAAESILMKSEGKNLREIRTHIDNKYKEGYGKPTPTPLPNESSL